MPAVVLCGHSTVTLVVQCVLGAVLTVHVNQYLTQHHDSHYAQTVLHTDVSDQRQYTTNVYIIICDRLV